VEVKTSTVAGLPTPTQGLIYKLTDYNRGLAYATGTQWVFEPYFNVLNFGAQATTDGSVDNLAAFNAAILAMGAIGDHPQANDLIVPAPTIANAYYKFSGPLHINRQLRLRGVGGSVANQYATASKLVWGVGMNGIIVDYFAAGAADGIGAVIQNLAIVATNAGATTGASGIKLLGFATIDSCGITGWGEDGIHIDASVAASNANQWRVYNCFVQSNMKNGLYVAGTDANAGNAMGNIFDSNGLYGIDDQSTLGNTYVGNEISSNVTGSVRLGFGQDVNSSVGVGNYIEAGQGALFVGLGASWLGGANGSGNSATSTGHYQAGNNTTGMTFQPAAGGSAMLVGTNGTYPWKFDTGTTPTTNGYSLGYTTGVWRWRNQDSDSFVPIAFTTPAFQVHAGTLSGKTGAAVFGTNGFYFGTDTRIFPTNDVPGAAGYLFGDIALRNTYQETTDDGALGWLNLDTTGSTAARWQRVLETRKQLVTKTTDYAIKTEDCSSGTTIFSDFGSSGTVQFTLPSVDTNPNLTYGVRVTFVVESNGVKILAGERSDKIYMGNAVTGTNGNITSTTVGNTITMFMTRFTNSPTNTIGVWYVESATGTWVVT
jgi:hypothetical protein